MCATDSGVIVPLVPVQSVPLKPEQDVPLKPDQDVPLKPALMCHLYRFKECQKMKLRHEM